MIIRSKADIEQFYERFENLARWDGTKHYIVLDDDQNNGVVTMMRYPDGTLTAHRKYYAYWDICEQPMSKKDMWRYRKVLNRFLKDLDNDRGES